MIDVSIQKKTKNFNYRNKILFLFTKVPSLSVVNSSPFDVRRSSEGAVVTDGRFNWPRKIEK